MDKTHICSFSVTLGKQEESLFSEIDIILSSKRIAAFVGGNGCGKTTLSYIIARFAPHLTLHNLKSDITYNGQKTELLSAREFWSRLSYTFQDPDCQYSEMKVSHEFLRMIPQRESREKIIRKYKLENLQERSFHEMSYGERQRVLWARDWASDRDFYILDEVGSYLDKEWQEVLANDLLDLKERGKTICIFGHLRHRLSNIPDDLYEIRDHEIKKIQRLPEAKYPVWEGEAPLSGRLLLNIPEFDVQRRGRRIRCPRSFDLHEREIIALEGGNGSGKTTLMMAICGLLKGRLPQIKLKYEAKSCLPILIMQNPYSQTVECTMADMLQGIDVDNLPEEFCWLNEIHGKRDPLSLSYGEQKAIHILYALHSKARLILIDEFLTGMSWEFQRMLEKEMLRVCELGKSIIISCHPGAHFGLPIKERVVL